MHISILDRALAVDGLTEAEVLQGVVGHARDVERLGYRRFLVAEHHGVPGIPGSQPTILAAAVASATRTIRVGTGGIMLPAHQPMIVAEQISVLEALFPGRVDVGIGSSVGFTAPVREALRQGDVAATKARFDDDLDELLAFLRGDAPVTARPANAASSPIWLLANFRSLFTAAQRGLGAIVGGPSLTDRSTGSHDGLARYRANFRPSPFADSPRAIASINVAVADTTSAARDLLLPQAFAEVRSRATGEFSTLGRLQDLELDEITERQRARIDDLLAMSIYGTPAEVGEQLDDLARFTGVDEILVTGDMSDHDGRARSERLLAELAAE